MAGQPPLGFCLPTHDRPAQALRLVGRLNSLVEAVTRGMKLLVAVAEILAFRKSDRLARHLRHALLPQECYFQTVLGNGGLRIRDRTLHYVHWPNEEVAHPSTLEDLDAVRENRAHFARKLDLEACPELYYELDRITSRP